MNKVIKEKFDLFGIEILEYFNSKSPFKFKYKHTNKEVTYYRASKLLEMNRKQFNLHPDILEGTRQYKDSPYYISKEGKVYSTIGVIKEISTMNEKGYKVFHYNNRKLWVHRMVLEAFGFPQPSPDHIVRHLNDIKTDNRLENLEWGLHLTNMKDKKHNTAHREILIRDLKESLKYTLEELSIITNLPLIDLERI